MDESAPIRAIVIGVSVLLAIATISAVLMYYNTAKQMASNVGRGQDFAENYEQSIQDILEKGTYNVSGTEYITGADVKNLLNYFYNDENVRISIYGLTYVSEYNNYIPKTETSSLEYNEANSTNYNKAMRDILDNERFVITPPKEVTEYGKRFKYIVIDAESQI